MTRVLKSIKPGIQSRSVTLHGTSLPYMLQIIGLIILFFLVNIIQVSAQTNWESKYIKVQKNGKLQYIPDEQGNIIPDFSRVGYHQNLKAIPTVNVVTTLDPTGKNDQERIQQAIDDLSKKPADKNGIRGAILLSKGDYKIPGTIKITTSGIVLRGEGEGTKLIATGKGQRKTIVASGSGNLKEIAGTRTPIVDPYVPVGAKSFKIQDGTRFKVGDQIVVFRPGTAKWIADLKMDQIEPGTGTVQWKAEDYNLEFERKIVAFKVTRFLSITQL